MRHEQGAFFYVLHGHPFAEPAACHQFLDSLLGYDLQATIQVNHIKLHAVEF